MLNHRILILRSEIAVALKFSKKSGDNWWPHRATAEAAVQPRKYYYACDEEIQGVQICTNKLTAPERLVSYRIELDQIYENFEARIFKGEN